MKICTNCKEKLDLELFARMSSSSDGYQSVCKICTHVRRMTIPRLRANDMIKHAKNRSNGKEFSITKDWLLPKLENGKCEVTGLDFKFLAYEENNPFAPSIDRIDNSLGYTPSNCKVVIWAYNCMKNKWDNKLIIMIGKALEGAETIRKE